MENSLDRSEFILYFLLWSSAVLYSISTFNQQSSKYFSIYQDDYNDFEAGVFSNSRKDIADLEWQTMLYLFKRIWIWIIIMLALSEKLKQYCYFNELKVLRITLSVIFILTYIGPIALIGILAQPVIFIIITNKTSQKAMLWISNIIVISMISIYKYYVINESFMLRYKLNEKENYLQILAIYWTNLRCFSYFMEHTDKKEKKSTLNLLSYCLYLPVLFNGPFIFYSDFKKNEQITLSFRERIIIIFKDLMRFIFWMIFIELALHFFYVNATSFQVGLVESFDDWALYGYGYLMGQYFHMKYLVVYGLSTSFAKFENIPVPSLPKCIGRIHLYSDMWKYFDNGLYRFLLRYIYIPMMKTPYFNKKILASLACFTFVYIWHGLDTYILIWVILNFIGIFIENSSTAIYKNYLQDSKIERYLGMQWITRITCLLQSFLLAMSAISNFFFFSNVSIGTVFATRVFEASFTSNTVLILALYCCCHFSTELKKSFNEEKNT
ncbi:protein-cysteine N-palmitoyltransferase Rasp [Harmonia axyridis]|uniref:protein-cysteine N-palmitoyltransferase Rasp n=1 Tax=Harmonia axyridis TaxID=115357 RepID=UPI001E277BC5|nr:protein-cysteine N-palmitoyltransferase Rasp [Harmonia axyridis]